MNKEQYIRDVENISADDDLKKSISELRISAYSGRKKKGSRKIFTVFCCILAVVVLIPCAAALFDTSVNSKDEAYEAPAEMVVSENAYGSAVSYDSSKSKSAYVSLAVKNDSKVIKNADLKVKTENISSFDKSVSALTNEFGGYESNIQYTDSDYGKIIDYVLRIPADKLDLFIEKIEKVSEITDKNISAEDVSDTYVDTESRLTALETEEKALLSILEKADNVADVITVQNELSEVRGSIESLKGTLQLLDSQITYSVVTINVCEVTRVIASGDSFGSQVKEKFFNSIYNIVDFFTAFAVFVLGCFPYLLIIAVIIAAAVIIRKKIKKKHSDED